MPEFDQFARRYQDVLAQGLSATGESREYFAHRRLRWLRGCVDCLGQRVSAVLDFGCGDGAAAPWILSEFNPQRVIGVDPSAASLEQAMRRETSNRVSYCSVDRFNPGGDVDLVYCNGVFHHIPPPERPAALDLIARALQPSGLFAFWENNPWNPGTRLVMSRIPFDQDAQMLSAPAARTALQRAGFQVLRTDFLFIFPRALKWLRGVEPALCKLPLGGQYQILCRKAGPGG